MGIWPALGLAYQITPKTVFAPGLASPIRGTPQYNLAGGVVSATNPIRSELGSRARSHDAGERRPVNAAQQIAWPNFNPGYYPVNAVCR